MCGRFVQSSPLDAYAKMLGAAKPVFDARPSYNVAPSQKITICRMNGERTLHQVVWGLVPFWSKEAKTGYNLINARAETVATKPSFREAYKRRRCLIPADGFFEWRQTTPKQPFFIHRANSEPFAMGGLWEHWEKDDQVIESAAIIVTAGNKLMAPIHDRMPVIIDAEDYTRWLDPENVGKDLGELMKPHDEVGFEAYPISAAVNKPANNTPAIITRIE